MTGSCLARLAPWLLAATASCAPVQRRVWSHPTSGEWTRASKLLAALRAQSDTAPFSASIQTTLRDGRSGRVVDGRGAIAFAPGRAVRMILLGAGGVTLLDAWVTKERWRIAVPPMDIVKRGDAEDPSDLPVGFLRWWFLRPLAGSLFAASIGPSGATWLLRDDGSVIELHLSDCTVHLCLSAARRGGGRREHIEEWRSAAARGKGDRVRYQDEVSGLEVDLTVEQRATVPPESAAFQDPDLEESEP